MKNTFTIYLQIIIVTKVTFIRTKCRNAHREIKSKIKR